MTTRITKNALPALLAAVEALTKQQVLVGIPGDVPTRKEPGAPTNPQIGFIQEFGSPAAHIPARPFLRPGVQEALPAITERLCSGAKAALTGDADAGTKTLMAVGLIAQNSVRGYINRGISPALAVMTLQARAARGRKGAKQELANRAAGLPPSLDLAKPLRDTGQLLNSITFVLRNK